MNFSEAWVSEYMERMKPSKGVPVDDDTTPDEGLESGLQSRCMEYCKDNGYPVFHDWSRGKNEAGWADLFIFIENSTVVLVELKSAGGRLSPEQKLLRQMLNWLGHTVYVCRSNVGFGRIMAAAKARSRKDPVDQTWADCNKQLQAALSTLRVLYRRAMDGGDLKPAETADLIKRTLDEITLEDDASPDIGDYLTRECWAD